MEKGGRRLHRLCRRRLRGSKKRIATGRSAPGRWRGHGEGRRYRTGRLGVGGHGDRGRGGRSFGRQWHGAPVFRGDGGLEKRRTDPVDLKEGQCRRGAGQRTVQHILCQMQRLARGDLRIPRHFRRQTGQDIPHGQLLPACCRRGEGAERRRCGHRCRSRGTGGRGRHLEQGAVRKRLPSRSGLEGVGPQRGKFGRCRQRG